MYQITGLVIAIHWNRTWSKTDKTDSCPWNRLIDNLIKRRTEIFAPTNGVQIDSIIEQNGKV